MPRKRHTAEEIIHKLREAEIALAKGLTTGEVVRQLGVTEQTYYRWRKEYGGMKVDQAKRLKELEKRERAPEEAPGRRPHRQRDPEGGGGGKLLSPQCGARRVEASAVEARRVRTAGVPRTRPGPLDTSGHVLRRIGAMDAAAEVRIVELAGEFGRYGYRRITALLQRWRAGT